MTGYDTPDYQYGLLIRPVFGEAPFVKEWYDTPDKAFSEWEHIIQDRIKNDDRQLYPPYHVIVRMVAHK